jgi:hypothetical protein
VPAAAATRAFVQFHYASALKNQGNPAKAGKEVFLPVFPGAPLSMAKGGNHPALKGEMPFWKK